MDKKVYWILGYDENLEYLVVGENTGPYSELPENSEKIGNISGNFIYFTRKSKKNGNFRFEFEKQIPSCRTSALDSIAKNNIYPNREFNNLEEIISVFGNLIGYEIFLKNFDFSNFDVN